VYSGAAIARGAQLLDFKAVSRSGPRQLHGGAVLRAPRGPRQRRGMPRNSLIDNTNFSRRHVGMPDALSMARQEQIHPINSRSKS